MDEAVALAHEAADGSGTVLLSPGCSSFDWYGSYVERGLDFGRIVRSLGRGRGVKAVTTDKRRVRELGTSTHRPRRPARFVVLAFMAMLMVLLGIVMVLSAASVQDLRIHGNAWYHQRRQLIWVVLGLAGLVATSRLDYRRLKPMAVWLLVGSVVLLLAVFIPGIGIRANGSSRWIGVGAATFQPSELAKLAVILYGSVLLSSRPVNDLRGTVLPLAAVLGGVGALVYAEPDLGTTIILAAIAASLLFFAGLRLAIVGATAALGISMMGAMTMTAGYRRERLLSMFDPWSDPLNHRLAGHPVRRCHVKRWPLGHGPGGQPGQVGLSAVCSDGLYFRHRG